MPTIVLIDSDTGRAATFTSVMRQLGYVVVPLRELRGVAHRLRLDEADLLVIGETQDESDANEICRQVRTHSEIPIMVLASTRLEGPEVLALDGGADDFLRWPASPRLVAARVAALLRRNPDPARRAATTRVVGPLEIDVHLRSAKIHGADVKLSKTEFELLTALTENHDRVVSRPELVERVWGRWHGDDHMLEVHISRLRGKIRAAGGPRLIESVPGFGYRLGLEPTPAGSAPRRFSEKAVQLQGGSTPRD